MVPWRESPAAVAAPPLPLLQAAAAAQARVPTARSDHAVLRTRFFEFIGSFFSFVEVGAQPRDRPSVAPSRRTHRKAHASRPVLEIAGFSRKSGHARRSCPGTCPGPCPDTRQR